MCKIILDRAAIKRPFDNPDMQLLGKVRLKPTFIQIWQAFTLRSLGISLEIRFALFEKSGDAFAAFISVSGGTN
jgi:hypothetical protein